MLSTHDLQNHLARISYKPGWALSVYEGAWEGQHFQITADLPDAYGNGELVTLDIHSPLPPMPNLAYFNRWIAWRLAIIEVHEAREYLKYDGRILFDPHALNANRDLA